MSRQRPREVEDREGRGETWPDAEPGDLLEMAFARLGIVGADPETDRTAERVAELYRQLFRGLDPSAAPRIGLSGHPGRGPVIVKALPFHSMCAHHLLPFFGEASVGYLPRGHVVGLGAIAEVVAYFAARPQLQERLAEQVADYLAENVPSDGVIVHLQARQMCVEMRGVRKPSVVEYVAARGSFVEGPSREEFLRRLRG